MLPLLIVSARMPRLSGALLIVALALTSSDMVPPGTMKDAGVTCQ